MTPIEIIDRIRATFDSYDPTDIDEQDHVLAMILDEEGPEALIQAVLDAAKESVVSPDHGEQLSHSCGRSWSSVGQ
jgi:hypothetical protein